jgi:hypothetical protein
LIESPHDCVGFFLFTNPSQTISSKNLAFRLGFNLSRLYLATAMKKAVCILILFSMVLHSASRLGVISYLYGKRHDLAYRVGLIAEIPIAICNLDHFSKQVPLVISDHDTTDKQLPVQFSQAKEINLFIQSHDQSLVTARAALDSDHNTILIEARYTPPLLIIFHPPCERA